MKLASNHFLESFEPSFFYSDSTPQLAKQFLGTLLCRRQGKRLMAYYIVETEAYLGISDPACHSYQNRCTPRTKTMYRVGGYSYVYLIYGMYHCFNIVTQPENVPEAVLIRALQPAGQLEIEEPKSEQFIPLIVTPQEKKPTKKHIYTNGPGKLCQALGITRKHNALPLWDTNSSLFLAQLKPLPTFSIISTPRIGIGYAGEAQYWPLRFFIKDNPFVSHLKST